MIFIINLVFMKTFVIKVCTTCLVVKTSVVDVNMPWFGSVSDGLLLSWKIFLENFLRWLCEGYVTVTNATVWLHLTMTGAVICFVLVDPLFLASYHHLLTDDNLFKLYLLFKFKFIWGTSLTLQKEVNSKCFLSSGGFAKHIL